jgi:hypothetical protein
MHTAADVRFTIHSAVTSPISPFIYGSNFYEKGWSGARPPDNLTLSRMGGNRLSAYNWENNASNAGSDWRHQNDGHLGGGSKAGEAVRQRVQGAFDRGAGIIVTVPMMGYVAADKDGRMSTDAATLATRLATRFRESRPRKGSAFSTQPDPNDRYVYQDEFVWWLDRTFPQARTDARRPIMYSLDNEPDIWHETHEEIRGKVDGRENPLTYGELVEKTVAYATAIKEVVPGAVVFGPALATWSGVESLGRSAPDPVAGSADFLDYYLEKMREAERVHGRRLLDVVDVHWYTEIRLGGKRVNDDSVEQTPEMIEARMQAPRSLWDPSYDERSWVNRVVGGPIQLLPRLREKIATHYPNTKIAITEYYYGGGSDISGGIAQADALGIFGREGVFAATIWPLGRPTSDPDRAFAYISGAFRMFRDYDGEGGTFGDRSISATTTDAVRTSVYASTDTAHPERVVVVAINKTGQPLRAGITLSHPRAMTRAEVYTLTDAAPGPVRQADVPLARPNALTYTMPAMSVSTLVLR